MRWLISGDAISSFVFRGNRAFFAYGGLYIRSDAATKSLTETIRGVVPAAPKGVAFVRWGLDRTRATRSAILIAGVGRFGNSIAQVLNSLELAEAMPAHDVLFHRFNAIANASLPLGGGRHLRRVRFLPQKGFAHPHIVWRTYAITPEILFCDPWKKSLSDARKSLQSATKMNGLDGQWSDPNQLTIYVRGGDVFDQNPERYYGQPPWVFYEKVLELKKWTAINLVSEDSRNPVVGRIVAWCKNQGLEVKELGGSLEQAMEVLKSSKNVVNARGTFTPAIVYLSEGHKTIYNFGSEVSKFLSGNQISVYSVEDINGFYTESMLSGNWRNSEEQRSLMVSYPRDSVSSLKKVS